MLVTSKKITVRENICLMQNVNFTSDYDSSDLLILFMIEPAHWSLINSPKVFMIFFFFFYFPGKFCVARSLCYQKCNILEVKLYKS